MMKEIRSGDYTIKANPMDNKSWKDADKIEVVLTFTFKDFFKETHTFKGIISNSGIVKVVE